MQGRGTWQHFVLSEGYIPCIVMIFFLCLFQMQDHLREMPVWKQRYFLVSACRGPLSLQNQESRQRPVTGTHIRYTWQALPLPLMDDLQRLFKAQSNILLYIIFSRFTLVQLIKTSETFLVPLNQSLNCPVSVSVSIKKWEKKKIILCPWIQEMVNVWFSSHIHLYH